MHASTRDLCSIRVKRDLYAFGLSKCLCICCQNFTRKQQILTMFKPFKPPILQKSEKHLSVDLTESNSDEEVEVCRPQKKRRLLIIQDSPPKKLLPIVSSAASLPRKPLRLVRNSSAVKPSESRHSECPEGYYMVLWYANFPLTVHS